MKNFSCQTCGSNNFKKKDDQYICDYCGATLVKKESYPKKRLVFISVSIAILLVGVFMSYQLLSSVKKDIGNLAKSHEESVVRPAPKQTSTPYESFKDENPFADVILKVEGDFKASKSTNSLEESLKSYLEQEMNKAFCISLDKDGNFAFGYAFGAKTIQTAEKEALKKCKKMKKKSKTKESCILYAINNQVSSFVVE